MNSLNELFNQMASEEEKKYVQAYHDLKTAIDSYLKLNPTQQLKLVNEVGVELYIRRNQNGFRQR